MHLHRRGFAAGLALTGLTGRSATASPPGTEVSMSDRPMAFLPPVIRIRPGDTVVWRNPNLTTHTVTCDPASAKTAGAVALPPGAAPFDSGPLEQGETFSVTFSAKGAYRYVCRYHSAMGMVGTVIVG